MISLRSPESAFVGLQAGPFRAAIPVRSIKEIVHMEGPFDEGQLPQVPVSLATLLGQSPLHKSPGYLLFESAHQKDHILSTCEIHGVFTPKKEWPLPESLSLKWPGLVTRCLQGTPDRNAKAGSYLALALDVLFGIVEAQ